MDPIWLPIAPTLQIGLKHPEMTLHSPLFFFSFFFTLPVRFLAGKNDLVRLDCASTPQLILQAS